jgi:hypothetical protein
MSHAFQFDPLPDNVKPASLICTVTIRTGEPKRIPFRLIDIPLPSPAGAADKNAPNQSNDKAATPPRRRSVKTEEP